jgi:hypothetical protein
MMVGKVRIKRKDAREAINMNNAETNNERGLNHGWTPMNTDTVKTLNRRELRERRLAAKEGRGSEIPSAGCGRKAGRGGLKVEAFRAGITERRVEAGRGGGEMGKSTGFCHLATGYYRMAGRFYRPFPDNLMQVVDFPHLACVSIFWEVMKLVLATDETQRKHGCRKDVGHEEPRDSHKRTQRTQKTGKYMGEAQAGGRHICILTAIFETKRSLMFA